MHTPNTVYLFIEIETKVYRKGVEISSENPEERRWYFSNVVVQPEDVPTYSLIKQKIMPYFSRNVMDPFEARGFALDYGEQDVRLNGEVSQANYETREEAEEQRNKALAAIARETEKSVATTMGDKIFKTYQKANGQWMQNLAVSSVPPEPQQPFLPPPPPAANFPLTFPGVVPPFPPLPPKPQ